MVQLVHGQAELGPKSFQSNPATEQRHLAQLMVEVTGVESIQVICQHERMS